MSLLTIVIPTLNRPEFLERALHYYIKTQCSYVLAIGDSSTQEYALKNQACISRFQGSLKVEYHYCPHLNDSQTIKYLMGTVKTPYAVFVADDDLLVPNGLTACVKFLERNPEYAAAHGHGMIFSLNTNGPLGEIKEIGLYRQPGLEQNKASQRLLAHLSAYSVTLFSVHRTSTWQHMYADIELVEDKRFTEILPCCLTVIFGKVKLINTLYLLRQGHQARYFLPDIFDWITNAQWQASYLHVVDHLLQKLIEVDQIPAEQAKNIVKQSLWCYLNKGLKYRYSIKYVQHFKPDYKQQLRSIPYFGKFVAKVGKNFILKWQNQMALLLSMGTSSYKDFKIFQSVIQSY